MTGKPNKADYMFTDKKGETLVKNPGQIHGFPFGVRQLEDCVVHLLDYSAQVTIDKCSNTTFVIGPCKGAVFIRDCENCVFHVACQQFRCRDLKNSNIFLFVQNDPIIEASSNLRFAPFNIGYPQLRNHVQSTELDPNQNKWELVFDFSKKEHQNFEIMPPTEFQTRMIEVEGFGDAELVLGIPQRYGGQLPDAAPESSAEMNSFGFTTPAVDAQKSFDSYDQQMPSQSQPSMSPQGFPQMEMGGGIQMQSQSNSFNSFQNNASFPVASSGNNPIEGDFTEEETMLMQNAEQKRQARMQEVHQFQVTEGQRKEERRVKARQALEEWEAERQKQIAQRRQNNIQNQAANLSDEESMKANPNKWIRICSTCDFSKSVSASGKDLSRMRDVMLSRKQDMANGGNSGSNLF